MQLNLMKKVINFVNILNLELNYLLKPKKVNNSKMTMNLWNSVINDIVVVIKTTSQGKAVKFKYFSLNKNIE